MKYTASVLGAVWSLLNPIVFLAVFSFVVEVFSNPVPDFPVFLLSGLLAWNFVANALQAGSRSVIDNANLVKKMAFPREILPLSSIGVALFDFLLQSAVLLLIIGVSGPRGGAWLPPAGVGAVSALDRGAHRVHGIAHVLGRGAQRALPRRGSPPEPRAARLVLGDADRVPGVARPAEARDDLVPRARRLDPVSTESGHGDRARVPARALLDRDPAATARDSDPPGHEPRRPGGHAARGARGLGSAPLPGVAFVLPIARATSRRSCDDRDPGRRHLEDVPALPRAPHVAQAASPRLAITLGGVLGAPRRVVRHRGGILDGPDRSQRLGEDDVAQVHRRDPASDGRARSGTRGAWRRSWSSAPASTPISPAGRTCT